MNTQRIFFLTLIVLGGVSFAFWSYSGLETPENAERFMEIPERGVEGILVSGEQSVNIYRDCQSGGADSPCSFIESSRNLPVSSEWLNEFHDFLDELKKQPLHTEVPAESAAPQLPLVVDMRLAHGDSPVHLVWGNLNTFYDAHYVRVNDDQFVLLPRKWNEFFRQLSDRLYDRRIFAGVEFGKIQQLVVSGPAEVPLVLKFDDEGLWRVNGQEADEPFVREYLNRLLTLEFTKIEERDGEFLEQQTPILSFSYVITELSQGKGGVKSDVVTLYQPFLSSDSKDLVAIRGESVAKGKSLDIMHLPESLLKIVQPPSEEQLRKLQ
ncbi:MAG: hypothetical protein KDD60_04640 [Bdellovibrionales bacterium]|nr:hypothetical protein [Bdellovibrionales bacterium]